MPTQRLDPAVVHRHAKTNALLKRGLYPGSYLWDREGFGRLRHPAEVSDADLKRIVYQPRRYPLVTESTILATRMASARFEHPSAHLFANTAFATAVVVNLAYGTLISGTGGITSLGTSPTWVAGYEWFLVDNTAAAQGGLQLDWNVAGDIQTSTTTNVTAGTEMRVYLVGSPDGTYWPDVFDGTPSAETITSVGVGSGFLRLAAVCSVDAVTQSRSYPFQFGARQWFQGVMPKQFVAFCTQNTGQSLGGTAGAHKYYAAPEYVTAT